jgi:hypothetical protein
MTEQSSTFGLAPKKLGRLLALYAEGGEEPTPVGPDDQKARLLKDLMSDVPPLCADVLRTLPQLLRQMYEDIPRLEGQSLSDLIQDPKTPLDDLKAIRDLAYTQSTEAKARLEHEAAGVVYYAAIAAAMVYHHQNIAKVPCGQLAEHFATLAGYKWTPAELRHLLEQARTISLSEAESQETQ